MSFFREQIVKRFTRSSGWRKVRKRHIRKQPFCQVCGTTKRLEVHHIKDVSSYPDPELDPNNLLTLCSSDHLLFGHLKNWKSINPEVLEDAFDWFVKIKHRR